MPGHQRWASDARALRSAMPFDTCLAEIVYSHDYCRESYRVGGDGSGQLPCAQAAALSRGRFGRRLFAFDGTYFAHIGASLASRVMLLKLATAASCHSRDEYFPQMLCPMMMMSPKKSGAGAMSLSSRSPMLVTPFSEAFFITVADFCHIDAEP